MQHEIPIHVFPNLIASIQLITQDDADVLNEYVEQDNLQGFLNYMNTIGLGPTGPEMQETSCKGIKFTLDIPDELEANKETKQCKSIW